MTYAVCLIFGAFFAIAVPIAIYQWLRHKWRTAPTVKPEDFENYRVQVLTSAEMKRVNDYYQRRLDEHGDVLLRTPRLQLLRGEADLPKTPGDGDDS